MDLSEKAWDLRYQNSDIGWDLGIISPPLKAYFDHLEDKNCKILIPGGGNSYEAEYLFAKGFKNVFVIDLSKTALYNLSNRVPNFPKSQLILGDFFDIKNTFDLVIEQTFFCAIHPSLRTKYVTKMHEILKPEGQLVGVLFNVPLYKDRPPFGGNTKEYKNYFKPYFNVDIFEPCYNSISSRRGREIFIKLTKK
ncbi:methyltransferase domain-containing protein [Polaribacter sp. WD7]|uniref:methyltransferase domain-containing protein n=1 Tax=Polaribacter sp. WD7 TaxID=2269061 RepID=UPI000DF1FE5C|nr:methyltransferase domain-containing protein [Polaribacter sp. WD7]RCS26225.1 methyltransferase domain-containing protein [Polaribacter sp. WD7]